MNIALVLSYLGTNYHGWQIQNNGASIQQTLEDALFRLTGERTRLSGVGRTDAGVHARRYVANGHLAHCAVPLDRLPLALASFLPPDIAVFGAVCVPDEFDARFDCVKKEYSYEILPALLPDPFLAGRAYRHHYPLDVDKMRQGARHFVGRQDFAAVRSQGTPVKSTVRTVFHCDVTQGTDELIRIRVCGDGFLYNMVRAIAGTLVYVGGGKIAPDEVRRILDAGDREQAGPTLPPEGLYLNRLWYDHTPALAPFALDAEIL